MLEPGSGDPTRAICSTLIARAFQSVQYPILSQTEYQATADDDPDTSRRKVLRIRHSSLFRPRDFDVSSCFRVIQPTLEQGFDYRTLVWADRTDIA
jgi:hypothetical protein